MLFSEMFTCRLCGIYFLRAVYLLWRAGCDGGEDTALCSRGLCHELPHVAAVRFDALVYGTGPSGLVGMTCKRRARIRQ